MPTGAQWRPQSVLVLRQARNNHRRHTLVHAEVRAGPEWEQVPGYPTLLRRVR
jgi:hypothetical protein